MLFVPMTPAPPPSPRVRGLIDHLESQVERYRDDHPGLTENDVSAAVRHLSVRVGSRARLRGATAFVGGVAALAGVGAAVFFSGSREAAALWETLGPMGVFGLAVAVVAAIVVLMRVAGR